MCLRCTYSGRGRAVYMDDAPHIWTHGVYGSMRAKSKVVNGQISRTLVHHLTDYVDFHLRVERGRCQCQV